MTNGMANKSVVLQDVRKSYGNLQVVHGIDLTIEEGEFVVFVGPSGCGKSTLLRMICLLYTSPSPRDGLLSRMPSSA